MASTNKTPNLELSQFIDTDKPAWMTDYNNDMSRIDTYCGDMKDSADELAEIVAALDERETQHNQALLDAIDNIDISITRLTTAVQGLTTRMLTLETNYDTMNTQLAQALQDIEDLKHGSNISDGAITTNMLADHCVTTQKLAYNSVTTDEILNGTIQYEDLSTTDCLPDIKAYVNS